MDTNERSLITALSDRQAAKALDGLRYWYGDSHTTFTAKTDFGKYNAIYVITTTGKILGAKANQMTAFIQGICYAVGN